MPVWEGLDYVDMETNASHRWVAGSRCHPGGPELTEEIADAVPGVSAPRMTPEEGALRFTYRREPYGGARISTDLGEIVIPRACVQPISRDESAWIDVYDI